MAGAKKTAGKKETPMMAQYWEYRRKLPKDTLLLFRLGDFYEMFHQDAIEGARLLGITQTMRSGYPMAGIPHHAAQGYLNKLLAVNKKVAICEQMETPQPGKLVKRALVRVLTPGTTIEDDQIDAARNHYLLAVEITRKGGILAAWLDLSTGEFRIAEDDDPSNLLPVFNALDPRELILPEDASEEWAQDEDLSGWYQEFHYICEKTAVTKLPDYHFDTSAGSRTVMDALKVMNLDGFGLSTEHPGLGAAGALVHYASESLCAKPENLRKIALYRAQNALLMDPATLRNLEIFKSATGTREASLMHAIDGCVSPPGSRLLERWLSSPLMNQHEIYRRQQAVEDFKKETGACGRIQDHLRQARDLRRILARMQNRLRNPREAVAVRETLRQLPAVKDELGRIRGVEVNALTQRIQNFDTLRDQLNHSLAEDVPAKLQDGGVIRDGYHAELDRIRALSRNNKTWLADLEREEQHRTGIKNLKIKYNGAFGYCIEVTKSNLDLVPENYIRKQTMKNAERFYTEELKQMEREILHAEEKAIALEDELFQELVNAILSNAGELEETADALAEADVFIGWAQLARDWDYCRPTVDDGDVLNIEQGRHPVVEQMLRLQPVGDTHRFVANDTLLSSSEEQIALITGPNMAGKSTYIRQVALITLLAQIGCWVPARTCRVGLVDRIFSRVGASDELARGNSTFMVEMNETANILNNATERSLVILDEIGRGTSTYDGLSIAWAVAEHLHGDERGPRTLFATHYHELTQLQGSLPRLRNYCVSVKEWNDEIIFVRQVIPGSADRSYGIQVARLAGLPDSVIARAKTILHELETEGTTVKDHLEESRPAQKKTTKKAAKKKSQDKVDAVEEDQQLGLF